jgi:Vacuolar protein sorting-associated protein 62
MTTTADLLARHRPLLKYDSQEAFFADAASEWTDCPGNRLVRKDRSVLATAGAGLDLAFLGPARYGNGEPVVATDLIGDPSKDYRAQARALHQQPAYANRMYGHAVVDAAGDQWLQYWFFYFHNDFNLIGSVIKAGVHEGDWEMIQIRLRGGQPDLAVYAQHAHAERRDWRQVDVAPATKRPIVYVARGSHASYFEPGTHWTGVWFDHADGKRRSPELALELVDDDAHGWVHWPGTWGDTRKGANPLGSDSPAGPGRHPQFDDPLVLLDTAQQMLIAPPAAPRPSVPPAPRVAATWGRQDRIRIAYQVLAPPGGRRPTILVVSLNSPDEKAPPTAATLRLRAATGTVSVPIEVDPAKRYDLYVSSATADGVASESVRLDLPPRAPAPRARARKAGRAR